MGVEALFWLAAGAVAYTYFGFPALVYLRGRLLRRNVVDGEKTPSLSLVIVAHDEARTMRQKLENVMELDYPEGRLEVLVASDGSTDATESIVEEFRSRGVRLLAFPRRGKIPALNDAVAQARGEVLVFSDANSMYERSALRWLVRPFHDGSVGGVAGNQVYRAGSARHVADSGERSYWSFDRWLKLHQSAAGSVTSATGAIYAIRRGLFRPVPGGVGDDAVVSYRIVAQGKRLIFEPRAVAYETVSPSASAEFRRKVRVCARGLRGLAVAPELFNPFRFGFYSLQLVSHKLLRWLMPLFLLAALVSSLLLQSSSVVFRAAAAAQGVFYAAALAGMLLARLRSTGHLSRWLGLASYFTLSNAACLLALWWIVRGRRIDRWDVRRGEVVI